MISNRIFPARARGGCAARWHPLRRSRFSVRPALDFVKPADGRVREAPAFDVFVFHQHDGPLFIGTPSVQDGPVSRV